MGKALRNREEIQIFQEYLRIPSVHPDIDYDPCVDFLRRQAEDLALEFKVVYPSHPRKPVCIISYYGTDSNLKSIMLSSHMDVVPVEGENWTHDAFGAEIDDKGNIYARGSQDVKCLGTQYLGALRYFIRNNIQFKRTIHVTFVPEEEIGGMDGMRDFVHTKEFKNLNVGFELDEGGPSPIDTFVAFNGERSAWSIEFKISGQPGHGSIMLQNTAAIKLQKLMAKFNEYRNSEFSRLNGPLDIPMMGRITSININVVNGGMQSNVIPSEFRMVVDCRISLDVDHDHFVKLIESWCDEAGDGITFELVLKEKQVPATVIDDSNKFWVGFKKSFDELNLSILPIISPGGTDARFIRSLGIPAIGFSPMNNTPILMHGHDEYINTDVYLKGIEIYKQIIKNVANLD